MKRFLLYIFSVITVLSVLPSCSEDKVDDTVNPDVNHSGKIALSIKAEGMGNNGGGTRAVTYAEAKSGENIKNWFVVIAQNNVIEKIISSDANLNDVTTDEKYVSLNNGLTQFYAFANMTQQSVLGDNVSEGSTLPADFEESVYSVAGNRPNGGTAEGDTLAITDIFPDGIPMSCKKEVTIDNTTNIVSLNLVRMVAKVKVEVRNPTADTVYIDNIELSQITRDNSSNVRLFPNDSIVDTSTGQHMVNLVDTTNGNAKETFDYTVPANYKKINPGRDQEYEFYVNESYAYNDEFNLNIERHIGWNGPVTSRPNPVNGWKMISRNEEHILVASVGSYRIDIFVEPYTAIGVLPEYDNSSAVSTISLGLYGHYDIVPRIRDLSQTSTYYGLYNRTDKQNFTTKYTGRSTNGEETDEIKIVSMGLQLQPDNSYFVSTTGWGENADGSGGQGHYPIVGWNATAMQPRIECIVGNYTGTADFIITTTFTVGTDPTEKTITRRIRVSNTYVDLSNLAKKR